MLIQFNVDLLAWIESIVQRQCPRDPRKDEDELGPLSPMIITEEFASCLQNTVGFDSRSCTIYRWLAICCHLLRRSEVAKKNVNLFRQSSVIEAATLFCLSIQGRQKQSHDKPRKSRDMEMAQTIYCTVIPGNSICRLFQNDRSVFIHVQHSRHCILCRHPRVSKLLNRRVRSCPSFWFLTGFINFRFDFDISEKVLVKNVDFVPSLTLQNC